MLSQKLNLLIQIMILQTILQVNIVTQNYYDSYLEQIYLKVPSGIAIESEKPKDANEDDKSSQFSQNAIKEVDEPTKIAIVKVTEPSSPQNTREVEATLAVEAEINEVKKEEESSNLLSSEDATEQVDKVNNYFLILNLVTL